MKDKEKILEMTTIEERRICVSDGVAEEYFNESPKTIESTRVRLPPR